MLLFWICLIVLVVCCVVYFKTHKTDQIKGITSLMIGLFSFVLTAYLGILYLGKENRFKYFTDNYNKVKTVIIESYDSEELSYAFNESIYIDNTIYRHGKQYDSIWVGDIYSKEIAELEPLCPIVANKIKNLPKKEQI